MKANKKKIIVLVSMVLLLVVTGTLNFVLGHKNLKGDEITGGAVTTFFASYRADRETGRAEEIAYLDSIISSKNASSTAKSEAEAQKKLICANIETELILEGLIKSQGFEDAVVTMSKSNLNVIIKDKDLTKAEVAKVLGVITSETSFKPSQVVIVPYNK